MEKPSALQVSKKVVEMIEPVRRDIVYDIVMTYYQVMSDRIGSPALKEEVLKSNGYCYCPELNEQLNMPSVKKGLESQYFTSVESYSFSHQEMDLIENIIIDTIGEKRYRKLLEKNSKNKKTDKTDEKKKNRQPMVQSKAKPNAYRIPTSLADTASSYKPKSTKRREVRNEKQDDLLDYLEKVENEENKIKGVIAKNKATDIAHWFLSHDQKYTYFELLGVMYYAYRLSLQEWNKDALHYELFENKFQKKGSWIAYDDIDNAYAKYLNGFIPKYDHKLPAFDTKTQSILDKSYQKTRNISKSLFTGIIKSSYAWKRACIEKNIDLKREDIAL